VREAYSLDDWFCDPVNTAKLTRSETGHWLREGKIVVPNVTELKKAIMQALHNSPAAGHPGVKRTLEKGFCLALASSE
jgi:hypothetical protein